MKILSWNCQGLANPDTVRSLRNICWRDRPNIVFVMETMIEDKKLEMVKKKCGFTNGLCLSSSGNSGGLGLWWNDVNVHIKSFSSHHIEAEILNDNGDISWKAIGVYGWADSAHKYLTWELLRKLIVDYTHPVLAFGDFNEIISADEKMGGAVRAEKYMEAFREALDDCSLRDLGYKGNLYTWQRGNSPDTLVRERLDRFLATSSWCSMFTDMIVLNLSILNSDHAPILLKKDDKCDHRVAAKMKRFESFWLGDEGCEKVVERSWKDNLASNIPCRINQVLNNLSEWAKSNFGDIKKRLKEAEKRLKSMQSRIPDASSFALCNSLATEINELQRLLESYWHIRAKAIEFRDGDKNTSYFHHKASSRKKRNFIRGLFDDNHDWKTDVGDFEGIISSFFQSLFATCCPVNMEEATEGIEKVVSDEMNDILNAEPTDEEIRLALFQMHPHKAPGPDGMHALFFQKFWHIIGSDITAYIKSWWRGECSLEDVNKTCISLIPKSSNPTCMNDYRPISLCNVIYKIASKTLANKLKPLLNSIISINQSAFVPKRLITDNALIGFEIFHFMKRRGEGKNGSIALKLDMSKAYDRVEWSFLYHVMFKMGFNDMWIRRVQSCLETVSFTFRVNGSNMGCVYPSRGLRQGDPISPYLFLLCAEAFSTLLSKAASNGAIHGIKICRGAPRISHLFFADDCLLFAKATSDECSKMADVISLYERASGQRVNLDKSELSFSHGVSIDRRWEIIETLGVNEVDRHERYLGLPTIIGRSKKAIFAGIKERIWKKIQGWKEKLLSKPGKEILIKAVAQAIPTYMMSIFRLPDGLLDDIHTAMAKFWWGIRGEERKLHWKAWESLCLPKAMGGMGFRDLKIFNQALLAKQIWRLLNDTGSLLYSVLKAKYFKNCGVLEAYRGFDPSFSWRSIWGSKSLLMEGLKWRVGNGLNINVWSDYWLDWRDKPILPTMSNNSDPNLRVCDLIDFDRGIWDEEKINEIFLEDERQMILDLPLSTNWPSDIMYWWPNSDGCYSVKSGYWMGRLGATNWWLNNASELEKKCWRLVWNVDGPPKLKHFLWRACHGCLAVKERLYYRHVVQDKSCRLCGCESETIMHTIFYCTHSQEIWSASQFNVLLDSAPKNSFAELLLWMKVRLDLGEFINFVSLAWASWNYRNKVMFEEDAPNVACLTQGLLSYVDNWIGYNEKTNPVCRQTVRSFTSNSWHKPDEGWFKVNVDAHVNGEGFVAVGMAVRDHLGVIRLAAVKRCKVCWCAERAEAYAMLYGMQLAMRMGFMKIILESDSKSSVSKVLNGSLGRTPLFLFFEDIQLCKGLLLDCKFSHVKRGGNCLAHFIAREFVEVGSERIWLDPIPQSFCNIADIDLID